MAAYGSPTGRRRRTEPSAAEPPSRRPLRATGRRRAPKDVAEHHTTRLKAGLAGLVCLVLLAVCGLGSWQILRDERAGTSALAHEARPTAMPRDIGSRSADPKPLTVAEVFPAKQLSIAAQLPAYQVLGTQSQKNCKVATEGRMTALIDAVGCSQVIRATLRSPTKAYLVTGGVFNLASSADAKRAYELTKQLIDAKQGRFKGYVTTASTKTLALSATHLGWDYRGHFLVYCVIARADGKEFADGDPAAQQILYDVIERHLLGKVIQKRAVKPMPSGTPTAS